MQVVVPLGYEIRSNAQCMKISYTLDSKEWFYYMEIPRTKRTMSLEYFFDSEFTIPLAKEPETVELRLISNSGETVTENMFVMHHLCYILYHNNNPIACYGDFESL